MYRKQKIGAIIVAAGSSTRMGGIDKMFAPLGDKPVLARVVGAFEDSPLIDRIVLVLNDHNLERGQRLLETEDWQKVDALLPGGASRQGSVQAGLGKLAGCDWVIIHDGARPLVTAALIEAGLKAAEETGAAVCAVPVVNTIKLADEEGYVKETPPRERLWAAQTPQVFRADIINMAYSQATGEVTDDSALVEALDVRVRLYQGDYDNLKLTVPADLALAEVLWQKGRC